MAQFYHPDTKLNSSEQQLLPVLDDSLLRKWCSDLSKYHPLANRYLKSSWKALVEQLEQLSIMMKNRQWFPVGANNNDVVSGDIHVDTMQSSEIRSFLQKMLQIASVLFHSNYHKHPINLVAHQVIHDLFRLIPEERFGNWRVSDCPILSFPKIPARSGDLFEYLPGDILNSVLGKMNLSDALRLRLVCKGWKDHVVPRLRILWIPHKSRNAVHVLEHLLKIVPKIAKVNLCSVRDPATVHGLIGLLEDAPLKSLRLETIDDHLASKLSRLSALRHLHISKPSSFVEFQSVCQAAPVILEKLSLTLGPEVDAVPVTIQRLTDLKALEINQLTSSRTNYHQFTLRGLEMLRQLETLHLYLPDTLLNGTNLALQGMDQLRELALGFRSIIPSDNRAKSRQLALPSSLTTLDCTFGTEYFRHANQYFSKLSSMTCLRRLSLINCENDLCESLAPLLASISTLNRLELALMMESSKVLIRHCAQIQQLFLINCYLDSGFLPALSNLTRLSSLEIEDCNYGNLKTRKLPKNRPFLPALQRLTVSECSSIKELSPLLNRLSHLHTLHLHSCVLDDSIVIPLQRMTLLDSLEMIDCSIDETSPCKLLRNTPVHLPIRHLRIDCNSAFQVNFDWRIHYTQLKHLAVIGFEGCSAWDCEWQTVLGTCDEKNLQTIDCACSSVLCQQAAKKISQRYPNTKVICHQSVVACDRHHVGDDDDDEEENEEEEKEEEETKSKHEHQHEQGKE